MSMKIVFFGSSHFGVPCFRALRERGYDIACAVTQPDRKKGRHLHLEPTAVKEAALLGGVPVYQPEDVNLPAAVEYLEDQKADCFVVIAYGQILSADLLSLPRLGAVNAHASLLPRYRGAAPINWAVINREEVTGVSIIRMNERMDAGPVLLQAKYRMQPEETALSLEAALSEVAAGLLLEALEGLQKGTIKAAEQNRQRVTYAPKLKKKDGLIDWGRSAEEITARVRGCLGWPGAYTYLHSKVLKIYAAHPQALTEGLGPGSCGEVLGAARHRLYVATAKGILAVEELQLEGGRRLGVQEFLIGHPLAAGEILG